MREEATIPVLYLRAIADQVRSRGADVAGWLGQSGLRAEQLDDPALQIPFPTFRTLVRDSLSLTGEPAVGLLVGQRLQANTHGMLGFAALSAGSIRQALSVFERYTRLRISVISIRSEEVSGELRVHLVETRPLGDIQRPVFEAVLMTVKNVLDVITLGACRLRLVSFPFPAPDYTALARDLFGCEVRYDEPWAGASLPVATLDDPLRMADPAAFAEAARICQRELDRLAENESLSARVRRLLLEHQSGFPSLQLTARMLHLTPRTLHRRLTEEGTSFREILEDVRHTLAVEHLRSGRFTIEEIAYTLGYSDLANFRRAFKRWEAAPPSEFRGRGERR